MPDEKKPSGKRYEVNVDSFGHSPEHTRGELLVDDGTYSYDWDHFVKQGVLIDVEAQQQASQDAIDNADAVPMPADPNMTAQAQHAQATASESEPEPTQAPKPSSSSSKPASSSSSSSSA
jgi:hypothetical protein